ncbi:hypothetical protein N9X05_07640 [Paracoccaceae bacterium]|nr:hypothetical protein [Paracoccaceae bacterium]
MAKVSIRIHSEVEEHGVLVGDKLQLIAEAHEGFCNYILGEPDKMKSYHQKMLWEAVKFLTIISELPRSLEVQSDI